MMDDDWYDHEEAVMDDAGTGMSALEKGAAYALLAHQVDRIVDAQRRTPPPPTPTPPPPDNPPPAVQAPQPMLDLSWDDFVGQDTARELLDMHIRAAKADNSPLPHILFDSTQPGSGKTTLARLVADRMGVPFVMIVPPFKFSTLAKSARGLPDFGILFIDEIHRLAANGPQAAEHLLHLLEERRIYEEGEVHQLAKITVIAASTDADRLPEAVRDRFTLQPHFEPYDLAEMDDITCQFMVDKEVSITTPEGLTDFDRLRERNRLQLTIARASQGVPRLARQMVETVKAFDSANGRLPEPVELLKLLKVYPDGVTERHVDYLLVLLRNPQDVKGKVRYTAGESTLQAALRENKQGLAALERFLMEKGLVDRTPQGRVLTDRGIERARLHRRQRQS